MSQALKQIMAEFDAAKEDTAFDEGHPIFQMAAEIDRLKEAMSKILNFEEEGHRFSSDDTLADIFNICREI